MAVRKKIGRLATAEDIRDGKFKSSLEPTPVMRAAPPGRPRTYVFVLLTNGKIMRRGHFFSLGKPDHRLDVEYQDFSALPLEKREERFREWAKRCDMEVL